MSRPWTDDPLLHEYRFCNVQRENDRVTRWVKANVRDAFEGHEHLWFMLVLTRAVNWPDTLAELIATPGAWPSHNNFKLRTVGEVLDARVARKVKTYTGAYNPDAPKTKGATKGKYLALDVLLPLWKDRAEFQEHFANKPTLRQTFKLLKSYPHFGDFRSYQPVVDMRFTPLLSGASDIQTWCACPLGSMRGLNRLAGRDKDLEIDPATSLREMLALYNEVRATTGIPIDLSDIPNILCETDKYIRLSKGEGKVKAKYVPGRGF